MEYEVRRVRPDEWARLRGIRLTALADAPHAFARTLDEESGYDERFWRERIARSAYFLGWDGDCPAGMVGGFRTQDGGWHVVSMWVSPPARGTGLAGQLIDAVASHARGDGAPGLILWVADGNDRAHAFYRRMGFYLTGRRQPIRPEAPQRWESEMARGLEETAG